MAVLGVKHMGRLSAFGPTKVVKSGIGLVPLVLEIIQLIHNEIATRITVIY